MKKYWWLGDCGHEWKSCTLNRSRGSTCPICNVSIGEQKIIDFLKKKHINFEVQKRFKNCKDKYSLPFDFV